MSGFLASVFYHWVWVGCCMCNHQNHFLPSVKSTAHGTICGLHIANNNHIIHYVLLLIWVLNERRSGPQKAHREYLYTGACEMRNEQEKMSIVPSKTLDHETMFPLKYAGTKQKKTINSNHLLLHFRIYISSVQPRLSFLIIR